MYSKPGQIPFKCCAQVWIDIFEYVCRRRLDILGGNPPQNVLAYNRQVPSVA